MIEIDGSFHEGGGQILRTSLALSAITKKPFHITKIRAGRCNPGLQAQHMKSVEAAAMLCNASVSGNELGSQEVTFKPKDIISGIFDIDVGTAGAIALIFQTVIPICVRAKGEVKLKIKGGTDVQWAPPMFYVQHILCDYLKRIGISVTVTINKFGFYPKGGGEVLIDVVPCKKLLPIDIQQTGMLQRIDVHSTATTSLEKANVAGRQIDGFVRNIGKLYQPIVKNKFVHYVDSLSIGTSIHAHAHFEYAKLGASVLGERDKKAETVGAQCAERLIKQIKGRAPFDEYMEDQIIPFMALSSLDNKSTSIIRVGHLTKHTET
ncbi:MAG: RNA 3'-terminal phosphate cyclase, partial [Candidatus Aenigmatarchaeota archaeon]